MSDIDVDYLADITRHQAQFTANDFSIFTELLQHTRRATPSPAAPIGLLAMVRYTDPMPAIELHTLWSSPTVSKSEGYQTELLTQRMGRGSLTWAAAGVAAYDAWITDAVLLQPNCYSDSLVSTVWQDLPLHEQLVLRRRCSALPLVWKSGQHLASRPRDLRVFTHGGEAYRMTMVAITETLFARGGW